MTDSTFLYLNLGDGTATIAITPHDDNTVELGVAFCSPKDRFVKRVGRELAVERIKLKKDFYLHYEKNSESLKQQAKKLVKFIVAGQWASVLDFDIELDTIVYEIKTETVSDFPCEVAPMVVHMNVVPQWAKLAVIENNLY